MNQRRRAAVAIALAVVGVLLMGLAYDKPQWYFAAAGITGAILFFVSLGWWVVSGLSEHDRRKSVEKLAAEHRGKGQVDA